MAIEKGYDFSGWVTKNDIQCSDGVIIRHNAFAANDQKKVPLVWNHGHDDARNVLGHVILHSRDSGVYGYGYFNESDAALAAKKSVQHGDIASMSIAANKIQKRNGRDVIHGNIYEVSLVLAGANPGAFIDNVITHADGAESAIIYTDCLIHSAENPDDGEDEAGKAEELSQQILEALSQEELAQVFAYAKELAGDDVADEKVMESLSEDDLDKVTDFIMELLQEDEDVQHADEGGETAAESEGEGDAEESDDSDDYENDEDEADDEKADELADALNEALTDDEKIAAFKYAKSLLKDKNIKDEDVIEALSNEQLAKVTDYVLDMLKDEDDEEEDEEMKHNVFANDASQEAQLQHSELCAEILADAERCGSLRQSMIQHGVNATIDDLMNGVANYGEEIQHSISTINDLLTVETFDGPPQIQRPEETSIVDEILNGVRTTPKHTVRKRFADLTTTEARAKGYIKGNEKLEEVFGTFDRVTHPQTIYKKQALDNDDLIDIDWDIVSFVRAEMKEMWRYELARAIMIGDGRASGAADKIKEDHIRPILTDDAFYTVPVYSVSAANFVEKVITAMSTSYKGTGTPTLYVDKVLLAQVRLLKDDNGRYIWGDKPISKTDLADLLGVKKIVEPDFFSGTGKSLIVNLSDYEIAAPNKGKSQTYEDFDIDYNKHKYLLEGRCAGAMVQPKGALALFATEAPSA